MKKRSQHRPAEDASVGGSPTGSTRSGIDLFMDRLEDSDGESGKRKRPEYTPASKYVMKSPTLAHQTPDELRRQWQAQSNRGWTKVHTWMKSLASLSGYGTGDDIGRQSGHCASLNRSTMTVTETAPMEMNNPFKFFESDVAVYAMPPLMLKAAYAYLVKSGWLQLSAWLLAFLMVQVFAISFLLWALYADSVGSSVSGEVTNLNSYFDAVALILSFYGGLETDLFRATTSSSQFVLAICALCVRVDFVGLTTIIIAKITQPRANAVISKVLCVSNSADNDIVITLRVAVLGDQTATNCNSILHLFMVSDNTMWTYKVAPIVAHPTLATTFPTNFRFRLADCADFVERFPHITYENFDRYIVRFAFEMHGHDLLSGKHMSVYEKYDVPRWRYMAAMADVALPTISSTDEEESVFVVNWSGFNTVYYDIRDQRNAHLSQFNLEEGLADPHSGDEGNSGQRSHRKQKRTGLFGWRNKRPSGDVVQLSRRR
eukprot:GFYU01007097.1.p1 GENE.GFYU01007097.1~~GFYU01007097.1.p1  ORF type:complete len:488 (+),score=107.54 GFYU01007097.1:282-1745(+)